MNKSRLIFWVLIAWPLPALIAGALGWAGIWGSGSALTDYLMPIPVAGGALHVPSFVVAGAAMLLLPDLSPAGASRLRALLIGAAIAGVLFLLNLQGLLTALKYDTAMPGRLWDENPLGLFLLCDALMALLFTAATPQRPWLRLELLTLVLVVLPLLLPVSMSMPRPRSANEQAFTAGMSQHGDQRGDEWLMVYTTLDVNAADFHARAEAWAAQPAAMAHPQFHISAEDLALVFTRKPEAARRHDRTQAAATLCLYEDGTPPRWLPGAGDCFSGHENFSERLAIAASARPQDEPADLRHYLAARELCATDRFARVEAGRGLQMTSAFTCEGLPRRRQELRLKFPDEPRLRDAAS